jgi:hypothetical protein
MVKSPESKKAAKDWNLEGEKCRLNADKCLTFQQIPSFNGLDSAFELLWLPHHCKRF